MLITSENMYDFKSSEFICVECTKCGNLYTRKMNSIRSNIKKNGYYICHHCVTKSEEYIEKQKTAHPTSINKKHGVICTKCGKQYQISHRTMQQYRRNERQILCRSCATKMAHKGGKHDYSILRSKAKSASMKGLDSENYHTAMRLLMADTNYIQKMRECGKRGAMSRRRQSYSQFLNDGILAQIDWHESEKKFGSTAGNIKHDSKLVIRCYSCEAPYDITCRALRHYTEWVCRTCCRFDAVDISKLPILSKVNSTRETVKVACQRCGSISNRQLSSVLQIWRSTGFYLCVSCATNASYERSADDRKQQFIRTAAALFEYDYSNVVYINSRTDVEVICPLHGSFWITPKRHILGSGCPQCACSSLQQNVYKFISGEINQDVRIDDRSEISPFEIDIFVPESKFGVELHGIYWHSYNHLETTREKERHSHKCDLCADKGVYLLQIFENEWRDKQDIVKSIIRSKLGKTRRIYARKCKVVEIDNHKHKWFMNTNHIQGHKQFRIAYGLEHNGILVAAMSFNKHKKCGWEISRFASELNVTVVGGASRLFNRFLRDYDPIQTLTYADRRFSDGNLYKQLGFTLDGVTDPNYFYIKDDKLYNRQKFQKKKLQNILPAFDQSQTEVENMFNNGYRRLWDAGHWRFIWSK